MSNARRRFSPEDKVTILRRHLLDKVAVSDLCEEYHLNPNVFYRWQKAFFENGAAAFERTDDTRLRDLEKENRALAVAIKSGSAEGSAEANATGR